MLYGRPLKLNVKHVHSKPSQKAWNHWRLSLVFWKMPGGKGLGIKHAVIVWFSFGGLGAKEQNWDENTCSTRKKWCSCKPNKWKKHSCFALPWHTKRSIPWRNITESQATLLQESAKSYLALHWKTGDGFSILGQRSLLFFFVCAS